jgi:hypothetical protein
MQTAKQQDGVAQDVSADVLGDSGENYEAAAGISKATTWREVGRRQGAAMGAVASYDTFVDDQLANQQFNSSAEYAAARAQVQKQFFKEAGLSGVKPQFLAQNVYPKIMDADNRAMSKWRKRFAIDDSAKTQDELFSSFSANKDVSSLLSSLRNTVDGQGNPLGYRGAWTKFDSEIVKMRQAGLLTATDVKNMQSQPIPGDPKGRTYGELHGAKFKNIEKQVAAQLRSDWNNSEADRKMEFEKAEQELVDAYLDDPDGFTDDQIEDAKQTLQKRFGMNSSELETLKANTVDAETRREQEEDIEALQEMGLLTPERLRKFDPQLQRKYMSTAQQQANLSKESGGSKVQLDAIKDAVESRVKLNKSMASHPAIGLMVAEMQRRYQTSVTKLAVGGDTNAANTALTEVLSDFDRMFPTSGEDKMGTNDVIQAYSKATLGQYGQNTNEVKARFSGISEALKTPNAVEDSHLMKQDELERIMKGYGKPGFSPGPIATFIGQQLGVDPLTVLNKQLELKGMDALPPTPAMEVVNNLTPRQQQLLQKYKTPERSARGLGGTGKYEASTVPNGYGEAIQQSADKYGIPPSIIAGLIETESNWNPNAVSHAGARGLAQFMPATAAEQGVNVSDPMSSIDGAAKYLSYLVDYFKGDMRKAIFAYNGGMGNIEKYGGPIPGSKENQEYYGKVMNGAYKYGYGKQSLQDPAVMRPSIAAQIPR